MAEWEVGQQVAKMPRWRDHGIEGPFTITAVKGRKVVLQDDSEWTTTGRKWGTASDRFYIGPFIEPWDQERHPGMNAERHRNSEADAVLDEVRRARARLTLEQIAAIRAVLAQGKS